MIKRLLKQDYARSAGESVSPNFWKGLILAYVAPLGNTGPTVRDFSGRGEHHPIVSITTDEMWKIGNNPRLPGMVFDFSTSTDGSADKINLESFSSSLQDYTFVFEVYVDDHSVSSDLGYLFDAQSGRMIIATSSDVSAGDFHIHDGTAWRNFGACPVGVWTHIVVTMNSTSSLCEVFFDGISQGTNTYAGTTIGGTVHLFSSYSSGWTPFNGKASYVLIYDRVFSDGECLEEFKNPLGLFRRRRRGVFKAPAVGGTTPKGPFGMPFHGPFGGPI